MGLEKTTLPVGTLLRERYLLKNILGAGHTGTVYLIKDQQVPPTRNAIFALKEMPGLSQQERYRLTFNGGLLQQLRHPALPSIYHIFNDDRHERIYLVMDYIEGTDLETLRQEQSAGRFAWRDLRGLLAPIFEALMYLHGQEQPIFHGDIKPANLIRQVASGNVVLVDLGYAQAAVPGPSNQFSPTALSTFRAPERLTGNIDASTDIYELGATLYMLVTGQAPLDAQTRLRQVRRGEADPLPLAGEIVSSIPHFFALILQRALSLDPRMRFATIQDFWQILNTAPTMPSQTEPDPEKSALPWSASTWSVEQAAPPNTPLPVGLVRKRTPRWMLTPAVAIFCVLLFAVLGISAWGVVWNQPAAGPQQGHRVTSSAIQSSPTVVQPSPTAASTPTVSTGKYPDVSGVYQGILNFLDGTPARKFTLTIQQQQNQLNGTFASSQQNSTFSGTIDTAGNVQFTVFNTSGDAISLFHGGLNHTTTLSDTLGGTFSTCARGHGATCQPGSGLSGGLWNLTQVTT